jgi:nitrogen-specific signal transduction histidine kinase
MKALQEERSSLEAQLHHSQKMDSLGRLAAGVAHDFNNILTVIQGHIGLLRSEPNLRPDMSESLQQVSRATERAAKLVGQLLTFTRQHASHPQQLDLNEVLTNLSMLLNRTLGEDVNVQLSYAADLSPIQADRSLIEQVILDLAVNAREAMPAGGLLVISTAETNIEQAYLASHPEARAGLFVCLSIIDTGRGIEPERLPRLFEPVLPDQDSSQPSNLLLATVHGIVNRHHGWIEVQSRVGQGSTFRIFLPASKTEQQNAKRSLPAIRGGRETILVVEDEPPVLWITRNILEHHGYRVLEATSGVEALAVWHQRQNEITLLLVDIVMPVGVSGHELAELFQQQKPGLKVIYISGYSADAAAKNLELVQGINFLQKPYDAEKLTLTVRTCLDG